MLNLTNARSVVINQSDLHFHGDSYAIPTIFRVEMHLVCFVLLTIVGYVVVKKIVRKCRWPLTAMRLQPSSDDSLSTVENIVLN